MSEEQLKELQEYNLEYLEAQQSEEIFGGDYTSAVELKYAKQEIEKLNNIINELNYGIKELYDMFYETFRISQNSYYSISEWELKEFTDKLQKLKEEGDNNE